MRELERRERDTNGTGAPRVGGRTDVVRTIEGLRHLLVPARRAGRTIGLVPTMGAFHEGHLSLMRRAREKCDVVVVSLFVNPTQFAPGEDLASYPRDERRDLALAERERVDVVFAPAAEEIYPDGPATTVAPPADLVDRLCGAYGSRGPEHFRGVATVVTKLFNIVQPTVAYFGRKDFQQALVIRRLVRDLNFPVRIEVCPTVRDEDGLALSSRNAYLSPEERVRAVALNRALAAAGQSIAHGANREASRAAALAVLEGAGVAPEYLEILDAETLGDPAWTPGETVVVALAATIGRARLIDNSVYKLPVLASTPVPDP